MTISLSHTPYMEVYGPAHLSLPTAIMTLAHRLLPLPKRLKVRPFKGQFHNLFSRFYRAPLSLVSKVPTPLWEACICTDPAAEILFDGFVPFPSFTSHSQPRAGGKRGAGRRWEELLLPNTDTLCKGRGKQIPLLDTGQLLHMGIVAVMYFTEHELLYQPEMILAVLEAIRMVLTRHYARGLHKEDFAHSNLSCITQI